MKRLISKAGETLPEVLVALLIVVMTVLFLAGSVISAARVNDRLENETVAFQGTRNYRGDVTVTIRSSNTPAGTTVGRDGKEPGDSNKVQRYETNGYYYYQ